MSREIHRVVPLMPAPSREGAVPLTQSPPLSVYVHFPWCVRKCPYCDFNSHEARGDLLRDGVLDPALESRYLDALTADLHASLESVWGRPVHTVFLGGGTPSLLSAGGLDRLLSTLRALLRLEPGAEITLEANPGTFEAGRFRDYAAAGVNRLSLGVQSFDEEALRAIGRIHDARQAREAAEAAARWFPTFNLDLMYGLPGQDLTALERDLETALSFSPPHLSCYHLTLEPNTLFARFPPAVPDDDLCAEMQDRVEERLAQAGLAHYEVSAYARPGHRARHNLNYWSFGDYLGLGAGAHGKISGATGSRRQTRWKHPVRYMDEALAGRAIESERVLHARDLPFEFMLNALRLLDGVPAALFAERTGLPLAVLGGRLGKAVDDGLLDADPALLRATPHGQRFLNDLLERFLAED